MAIQAFGRAVPYVFDQSRYVTEYKGGERVAAFTKMATREDKASNPV